jgi:CHAT domain-containing protein
MSHPKENSFIRILCLGLFFLSFFFPIYSLTILNDSVIDRCLWNADYQGALKHIDLYKKNLGTDKNQTAFLFLKASEVYLQMGNTDASRQMIARAEAITAPMSSDQYRLRFQYAFQKGQNLVFMGKDAEALLWLNRAERIISPRVKNYPADAVKMYTELGDCYMRLRKFSSAIQYYELSASLKTGKSQTDKIHAAYDQACLAEAYWLTNDTVKASRMITSCLKYLSATNESLHPALLNAYFIAADYYLILDRNITLTKRILLNASLILKKYYPADHYKYGMLYYYKAELNYFEADYESAFYYCNRALDLAKSHPCLNNYRLTDFFLLVRIYYWYKQDYEKAIQCCHYILNHSDQFHHTSLVHFYYLMALSYVGLNQDGIAADYFNKITRMVSATNDLSNKYYYTDAYRELGNIALNKGNYMQALEYFQKALYLAQKTTQKNYRITNIYFNIALTYYLNKNYPQALHIIQQSIIASCTTFSDTTITSNPQIKDIWNAYPVIASFGLKASTLTRLYEKEPEKRLEYLVNALKCQKLAVEITENFVNHIDEENSSLSLVDMKAKALNNAVYYSTHLYLRTGKYVYAEEALKYSEKSKMQVLQINMGKERTIQKSGVPETLIDKEVSLNHHIINTESQLALLEKKGGFSEDTREALSGKLATMYDLRAELGKSIEKYLPPGSHTAKDIYGGVRIRDIQHLLSRDQVIVEYQLLMTELFTFVIAKDTFSIRYQKLDKKFRESIAQLRTVLTTDPMQTKRQDAFRSFTAASHYLYDILIEPAYKEIKGKRLIIIPHNDLSQIPFEVLISKLPGNPQRTDYRSLNYLIKEFTIAYAYSANLLIDQEGRREYGSGTAVFVPDYQSYSKKENAEQFPVLKGAAAEALSVKKLSHGRIYKGDDAGEAFFKRHAGKFRVLHIASHTLLDEDNPFLSALVMTAPGDSSEDGILYSYELSQMKLKAQLVVLSGCNTGYGQLRKSEGLVSVSRSLFYTGVRTVAYTLWPVTDKAGSELVGDFYKEIRQRRTLDCALRNAKLEFLENADPVKANPFYWAGYVLVGKTDCVKLNRFSRLSLVLAGSAALALLLFFIYRKING